MTIAKRQLSQIQNILREGSNEIIQAQKIRKVLLDESEHSVSEEDLSSVANEVVDEYGQDMSHLLLSKFNVRLGSRLASYSNSNKMFSYNQSGTQILIDLEDFDPDGIQEIQREFADDVVAALENYSMKICELAIHVAQREDNLRAQREDSQGETSEYMGGGVDDTDSI